MSVTKLAPVSLAMFYGANRDFANAFSVRVTLKNPVEPEPLRRALDKAMTRYPYFAVRLQIRGEALVLEDTPPARVHREGTGTCQTQHGTIQLPSGGGELRAYERGIRRVSRPDRRRRGVSLD